MACQLRAPVVPLEDLSLLLQTTSGVKPLEMLIS